MDRRKWTRELRNDILAILEDETMAVESIDSAPGVVGLEEATDRIMKKIANLLDVYFEQQEMR